MNVMLVSIYDNEIYDDHNNFLNEIWHVSFMDKNILINHDICGIKRHHDISWAWHSKIEKAIQKDW